MKEKLLHNAMENKHVTMYDIAFFILVSKYCLLSPLSWLITKSLSIWKAQDEEFFNGFFKVKLTQFAGWKCHEI